ncbi:hypothetical protein Y032_0011g1489 [Ancylostoma ceylanicum]|nr:hypothetical protein Y032_0011g1489 [Ancylostoma ceylanicum]
MQRTVSGLAASDLRKLLQGPIKILAIQVVCSLESKPNVQHVFQVRKLEASSIARYGTKRPRITQDVGKHAPVHKGCCVHNEQRWMMLTDAYVRLSETSGEHPRQTDYVQSFENEFFYEATIDNLWGAYNII